MQCTDSFSKTLLITGPYIFVINKFTNSIPTCVISWPSNLHARVLHTRHVWFFYFSHCLTSETIEYLETFLRIPRNKTTFSSCRPYILYYCTVAATSAATKMPYTTVYLHIHAMCSRKLNSYF